MEVITKSAKETFELGYKTGHSLKAGSVLALKGDLGSGKTTFIQGLASALGIKRIISPTFILMRSYGNFYHLDLYRLEGNVETQVKELGFEEIAEKDENIVVIEWAEKAKNILPKNTHWIYFESLGDNSRKIIMEQ